jgi:3'-phosphoadenosine 5'-phosphosulfate sulfotransferase (PAPS reductase)/FAD synthetase
MNKKNTKHIAMFSGGKDSTRMVLELIRRNYPLDYIVFADLGAEWPQMYEHITQVESHIGREILRVNTSRGNFDYWFQHHTMLKGRTKGQVGYGWCGKLRWGTSLKRDAIKRFTGKLTKQGFDVIEYHGMSLGEESRLGKNNDGRTILYPLVEWGMTEANNLQVCYDAGFSWGGLYGYLDRVSCWCCENKNLRELKNMYNFYPEIWRRLEELQKQTQFLFKGKGVSYFSRRFAEEQETDMFGYILPTKKGGKFYGNSTS